MVRAARYFAITNDEQVTVSTRDGRWTKSHYLPAIQQ